MLRGSQAPRRAVCGTRGSLRTMHGGVAVPLGVVTSPTGLPSKRSPGLVHGIFQARVLECFGIPFLWDWLALLGLEILVEGLIQSWLLW